MTKRITSFFALTTFVLAVSGSAFAADIAVKAPLPAPTPVYNWTGWYVGVNAGASFGRAKTDFNDAPVTVAIANSLTSPGFGVSDTQYPSGFMGGGQIGYNWQYSPLIVVGLEADFQGALERDNENLNHPFTFTGLPFLTPGGIPTGVIGAATGTAVTNYTTQIDWFGTVRGRIGYVWGNGQLMSYITGGLAYGEVKINGTNTVSGAQISSITVPFSVTQAFGHSQVNTGWVVGYGTEGHLPGNWIPGNWTWKIEGLYMDLGTLDTAGVTTGFSVPAGFTGTGGQVTTHTHFTDGILRGGLNYKFN
jgi:outer membrane immunogenic protein